MSAVQLRAATEADCPAIMGIETAVFGSDAWSEASLRSELDSPHTHYAVAVDAERVVGYAGLLAPSGALDADVQTIAVAPDARRRGIGRALLTHLMDAAAHRRATALFLEVRADNLGAQCLYADLCFDTIAVRRGYYQPDGVDALVMRAALAPPRSSRGVGTVGAEAIADDTTNAGET